MQYLRRLPPWATYVLLAYMPFHILLSQWLSTFTGGLEAWKVAKDVVAGVIFVGMVALVLLQKHRPPRPYLWLLLLALAYFGLHVLVFAGNRQTSLNVALLATVYNTRLFGFLLIGMSVALLMGGKTMDRTKLLRVVLVTSLVVSVFAVLQYWSSPDLMTHFGYSLERGVKPNFLINENPAFPRSMSTLRDPNSLGAYLLVPIVLLVGLVLKRTQYRRGLLGLLAINLAALYVSFSRAAWGGLLVAEALLIFLLYKEKSLQILRRFWVVPVALLLALGIGLYTFRDSHVVRSVVLRIDDTNAPTELDSDQHHWAYIKKGIDSAVARPGGYGPGTAGVVSIQNPGGSFLTENYYLQITREVGVLGLLLFVCGWAYVAWLLWRQRSFLATVMLATGGAYALMAMIMHLWINEAVAVQWWLLAGVAIGVGLRNSHNKQTAHR